MEQSGTPEKVASNDGLGQLVEAEMAQYMKGAYIAAADARESLLEFARAVRAADRERLREDLKIEMQHSAWDGALQLDDAQRNIADALA